MSVIFPVLHAYGSDDIFCHRHKVKFHKGLEIFTVRNFRLCAAGFAVNVYCKIHLGILERSTQGITERFPN